jgi:hypothetical protein
VMGDDDQTSIVWDIRCPTLHFGILLFSKCDTIVKITIWVDKK